MNIYTPSVGSTKTEEPPLLLRLRRLFPRFFLRLPPFSSSSFGAGGAGGCADAGGSDGCADAGGSGGCAGGSGGCAGGACAGGASAGGASAGGASAGGASAGAGVGVCPDSWVVVPPARAGTNTEPPAKPSPAHPQPPLCRLLFVRRLPLPRRRFVFLRLIILRDLRLFLRDRFLVFFLLTNSIGSSLFTNSVGPSIYNMIS